MKIDDLAPLSENFMAFVTIAVADGKAQVVADRIEKNLADPTMPLTPEKHAAFVSLLHWLRTCCP